MPTQQESAMRGDRARTNMNPTSRIFLLYYVLFIYLLPFALSQQQSQPVMLYHDCVGKGNYTTNSTYQSNLNSLLTSIYTNTEIDYGFYNSTYGDGEDKVFAIALCRPDITPDTCRTCIRNVSDNLTTICSNFKEAIGGHDNCMVRYTNRTIFYLMEGGPYFWVYSLQNVSNITGFNQTLFTLLDSLRDQAARGDSRYKYATGQIAAPDFQTIYGLVQCTPDLSQSECINCLYNASGLIPTCCTARNGGRVIYPSCNFRYEISRFYETISSTSPSPSSPSPPPASVNANTEGKKSNNSRLIIILVVSIVSSLILAVCMWNIFLRARKRKEDIKDTSYYLEQVESLQYEFETIRAATNNFAEANKLGQGGFGAVYKGTLSNGQDVAVKRLSKESKQGEMEFKNEVLVVAKLLHRNLVRLLGFCLKREERLLVYEFLTNSSLDRYVFDPVKRENLDWATRYKIIEGVARGLLYLHEDSRLRIIHRDLKSSNILLDEEMNAKISDFGMARMFDVDQTQGDTSRIVGTFGYMAPEYVTRGHFSVKSDVFSFGVLVLEILSGKRNSGDLIGEEQEDLLTFSWRNWNQGTPTITIDSTLRTGSRSEMMRCLHIGLLCVQENEADRPSMAQVEVMLSSFSLTLPVPLKPAFFMHSSTGANNNNSRSTELEDSQSQNAANFSENKVSITDPYPR